MIARTMNVITKRISPNARREAMYMVSEASVNSLASEAEMVVPGAKIDAWMRCALPMTNVTAMVSPSARPSPSIIAPIMPFLVYGRIIRRHTSQTEAPVPYAASRNATGTVANACSYRCDKGQDHYAQDQTGGQDSDSEGRSLK